MESLGLALGGWCVSAVIGYFIGRSLGRGGAGLLWGLLLGPVGWLVLLMLGDPRPQCPLCKGRLETLAVARCRHCGGELRKARPGPPPGIARDPLEAWEEAEALKPENLRPLRKREPEAGE
jgi:hypothetical protein